MKSHSDWASRYVNRYSLALVEIPLGHKAPLHPGWNQPGGYITDAEVARQRWTSRPDHGIGVVLAPSGLCSLDIDCPEHAEPLLAELGVDLRVLRESCPTVQGKPDRYRILFRVPEGSDLSAHKLVWPANNGAKPLTLFELRAGPVQDVLPPTIHPGTGKPYKWLVPPGTEFPELPAALLELWTNWDSYRRELEGACPWAQPFKPETAPRENGARADVIGAFNQAHTAEALLKVHGYKRHGRRWMSPTSTSGLAGAVILDGRVFSHHASDPLNDGHSHDAFDVYRILDHGGDMRVAIKAAAEALGMGKRHTAREKTPPDEDGEAAPAADIKATIARLAKLHPIEYDHTRQAEADELGVRVTTLDTEVRKARGEMEEDTGQGQAFTLENPDLWWESVDGGALVEKIAGTIESYVLLPSGAAIVISFWVLLAHCFELFYHVPRLNPTAPQKGCGKSTLLDVIEPMLPRALRLDNLSTAVFFRLAQKYKPCFLIDEYDKFLKYNEELLGGLNAGHKRGGQFARCEGDSHDVRLFGVFCPVVLAGIGALPTGTLTDRSIVIRMTRAREDEIAKRFDGRYVEAEQTLGQKAARWVDDHKTQLSIVDPPLPDGFYNRRADNWRPLFSIAAVIGGEWPQKLTDAALAVIGTEEPDETLAIQLLIDIRDLFTERKTDRLRSQDIADALGNMEELPWFQFGKTGKPITQNAVARLLKPFGLRPKQIRFDGGNKKGYELGSFAEVFSRFLDGGITTDTPIQPIKDVAYSDFITDTNKNDVSVSDSRKPNNDVGCIGVSVQKGGAEQIKRIVVL